MKMIQDLNGKHTAKLLCEIAQVSAGSYYRWVRQAGKSAREHEDEQLKEAIMESWRGSRQTYGSPRIERDLRQRGIRTSRKRILRLMKDLGIEGCYNRRKNPLATDSRHGGVISENLLKDEPFPEGPRQVVVTDTTYVWTDQGWHYLATVMDLFSREIVGWSFGASNDRHLVCQALWNASAELKGHRDVIHHSDRGSTYCSEDYRELVDQLEMRSSMSAKGYCYDNAHMESFFGSLKCECRGLDQSLSPQEVRRELFDYIEGFYNTHRIHTALGSVSPREFAQMAVGNAGTAGLLTPPSATNNQSPFSMEREQPGGKNTSVPAGRQSN